MILIIHIELAFQHAIIQLSALIGPAAIESLKFFMGCNEVIRMSWCGRSPLTEDLIDFLGSLSIQQAFAIGRIAEQDAIILRQYQAPDILPAKLNQIIHMRLFGILSA